MDQPYETLDLSILLFQPPLDASSDSLAGITLTCNSLGLSHTGDLLLDPLTQREKEDLRWYLEEYWKWPYEGFAERGRQVETLLQEVGQRLYNAVFGSNEGQGIISQWQKRTDVQHQISIQSNIPRVLSLPWELLHDNRSFLALDSISPISIVRCLPQPEQNLLSSTLFEPPLRVLLITSRPIDAEFIDPRSIAYELIDEVQAQAETGAIEIEFLRPPTFAALRARLLNRERPIHILHFDGHGVFDEKVEKQGVLLFETVAGRSSPIRAGNLAKVLRDSEIRLVVLTACQSAMSATDDAFGSVAAQLIRSGVNAVVAMSASFLVASAKRYVEALYRAISEGVSFPLAQEKARWALHDDPRRHPHRRRRDDAGRPIELHDWWVPHFYQQHSVVLQPVKNKSAKILQPFSSRHFSELMPAEPHYGFNGRAYELLQLERWLLRGKLLVIHGFGGVGKTALAREAADWLTRTKMYIKACFVSFEQGGDAKMLLRMLGNQLGINDETYNPTTLQTALEHLKRALREERTLVIVDNLDSILGTGEYPLEAKSRTQLWDTLLYLAQMGFGLVLTTRNTTFDEARLNPSSNVAYLPLAGLHPEDAYMLASQLLDQLQIDRVRAPYEELCDLLAQLDYHPLTIQLVLPTLRELSLSTIKANFVALLPKFVDEAVIGRNRSLSTSLHYSIQQLSAQQQQLLIRLVLFEGGAMEDNVLEITGIPKAEWQDLRSRLEQVSLIRAQTAQTELRFPYLQFHPILMPFLRTQPGANNTALLERYINRYLSLAISMTSEIYKNPAALQALLRWEFPNLLRTIHLLLEAGNLNWASFLLEGIADYFIFFGRGPELDEIRRRINNLREAASSDQDEILAPIEYFQQDNLARNELEKGNWSAAITRFTALLARIEALPEGPVLARGSYEHFVTLDHLAICLMESGRPVAAEHYMRKAVMIITTLVSHEPTNTFFAHALTTQLINLGNAFLAQNKYLQAQRFFEEGLKLAERQGPLEVLALAVLELGTLALGQDQNVEAEKYLGRAIELFSTLNDPVREANAWHNLGRVAENYENWAEAERCYRQSLLLRERRGGPEREGAYTAGTFNQLALVAWRTGRPSEAEGWLRRAIALHEQMDIDNALQARHFDNLARLLLEEVQAGHAPAMRLNEAREYAERALAIKEAHDDLADIWQNFKLLADISEQENRVEEARLYRRRANEAIVSSTEAQYRMEHRFKHLITTIAAAAKGDQQARKEINEALQHEVIGDIPFAAAIRRLLAGERDWHLLTEDIDPFFSLLVLWVLEMLKERESQDTQTIRSKANTLEEVEEMKPLWNVPYPRIPYFTGREDILQRLHDMLITGKVVALAQSDGGIGNTQTAVEYAYRYRNEYHSILWANADSYEVLLSDFDRIADFLSASGKNKQDQEHIVDVKHWLNTHNQWLLILDKVENLEFLDGLLSENLQGSILLTTYVPMPEPAVQIIELKKMSEEEGALFLLRRARLLALDAPSNHTAGSDFIKAKDISRTLNNLPLALDLAGAYLFATGCDLTQYLELYQQRHTTFLEHQEKFTPHLQSIITAFSLSFERIEQTNKAAAELIRLCAFLYPEMIPEEILTEGKPGSGWIHQLYNADVTKIHEEPIYDLSINLLYLASDPLELKMATAELLKYSLIQHDHVNGSLRLHRLIQTAVKVEMDEVTHRLWAERAVRAIARVFPNFDMEQWPKCRLYLPQARECITHIMHWSMISEEISLLLTDAGRFLGELGLYPQAELFLMQAVTVDERMLGLEHAGTAISLNNLAMLYHELGKYAQAASLHRRALTIKMSTMGPGHPSTATSMNNLAMAYHALGNYAEAHSLYHQALAIREQVLGPEHLDTAGSLNNLSSLYHEQGKYAEAESLLRKVLTINERELGSEHPHTARYLSNVAQLCIDQEKYDEAEALLERALKVQEQELGLAHPHTVTSLGRLASLYADQGRFAEAEPLYRQVLEIDERTLGPEHPDIATSLNNLACFYRDQRKYAEAEPLYLRALAISERVFGFDHRETAMLLGNLAMLYDAQERYAEAEVHYQEALTIQMRVLGNAHPHTAITRRHLANLYLKQDRPIEAEAVYKEVL